MGDFENESKGKDVGDERNSGEGFARIKDRTFVGSKLAAAIGAPRKTKKPLHTRSRRRL